MSTDEILKTACRKIDEATSIWARKMKSHYRIADRLYREAIELRKQLDSKQ